MLKDESYKMAIGETAYWYLIMDKTQEKFFYKGIVEGYGEPPHEGGVGASNNHKSYRMWIQYAVIKKEGKLIYTENNPSNAIKRFVRNPRRETVHRHSFLSELDMSAEIERIHGVTIDELKRGKDLSTSVDKPSPYSPAILIDTQEEKEIEFPSLSELANHIDKKEETLLKAAVYTGWICPRYQMRLPHIPHQSVPFRSLHRDIVYSDLIEAWRKKSKKTKDWNPNSAYLEVANSIKQGTYQFEYRSHRYQLLNPDGSPRQSRWFPDIERGDSFAVKMEKIKKKGLEIRRSPFVIALTLQTYRPHLITEREVERIYRETCYRKLDLSKLFL